MARITEPRVEEPTELQIASEIDSLVTQGKIDDAVRLLQDALAMYPHVAALVTKREALAQWLPPEPGARSGVAPRGKRSTGLKNWHSPPPVRANRQSRPSFHNVRKQLASRPPNAAPPPGEKKAVGLKLWSTPPAAGQPAEELVADRATVPPEIPRIELEPVAGLVVAGKYRLERVLKQGGMGVVWLATHLDLDRPVAVKFMRKEIVERTERARRTSDPGATPVSSVDPVELTRARFEREARAAARIRSVNVVQVFDHGVDRGLPYIVMELLEGEDLASRLEREGRLGVSEMAALLPPIAHALARAHEAGVIHRDLKPENVFLAKDGEVEVIKILDFGVSKTIQGAQDPVGGGTLEGSLIGTPFYMSPEQAVGRPDVDHRSDLWSLGIILYRALTGRRPFASQALLESVVEIASAPIPPPSSIQPELGPEVDAFFERALARKPTGRFDSAKEMARAFCDLPGARPDRAVMSDAAPAALRAPAVLPEVPVELDLAPAQPSRRWGVTAFAAAGFAALGIGGWIAMRPAPSQSPEQALAPTTAAPTAAAVESAAAVPAAATTQTPVQNASAAPAASALLVPGARPGAPVPIPGKRKGKRDVGY